MADYSRSTRNRTTSIQFVKKGSQWVTTVIHKGDFSERILKHFEKK